MSGQPEHLLRSALEKIVFFECRIEQLEAELRAAQATALRAQQEAAGAREREAQAMAALARARSEAAGALEKNGELVARVQLLDGERERFMTSLIEQARVASAPGEGESGEGIDLATFIAELRAEVERLKAWKLAAQKAGIALDGQDEARTIEELRARAPQGVPALAAQFEASGRIGVRDDDARRLESLFATRAERALYEQSMRDLASADPGERRRAAECLKALKSKAASPLVAAALGRERDEGVKVALLGALAALAQDATAAGLAGRELEDPRPAVRLAALDAVSAIGRDASEPAVMGALGDASALVRRRAALWLGYGSSAASEGALVAALGDADAGVARAAALSLAGRPSATAQAALAKALDHADASVRRAAARAVEKWAGEKIDAAAPAAERRSTARRIAEKLRALGEAELRGAVMKAPSGPAPAAVRVAPPSAPAVAARPAIPAATTVAPASDAALESALLGEIRVALRGQTADDLARAVGEPAPAVGAALAALVARGTLVARGPRYFVA